MTYGILKVICAIKIVLNPREIPNAIKASIREMPVTISAFSIGILVIPMKMVRGTRFMPLIAMAAAVPIITAIREDKNAMSSVLYSAVIIVSLENICVYHLRVNPPHCVLDLELLNDKTVMVAIGAYKNMRIITR
jgi:hypothetical protein